MDSGALGKTAVLCPLGTRFFPIIFVPLALAPWAAAPVAHPSNRLCMSLLYCDRSTGSARDVGIVAMAAGRVFVCCLLATLGEQKRRRLANDIA
jgi:hypothetical protein